MERPGMFVGLGTYQCSRDKGVIQLNLQMVLARC